MELLKWLAVNDRYSRMFLDKALLKYQLNSGQYFYILKICEDPGITQDRLLSLIHVNPSNITRAITYLEKTGFLEKEQNVEDRRTFHLYPTLKSTTVYNHILQIKKDWEEKFLCVLNQEEKEMLHCLLQKVGNHAIKIMKKEKEEHHESNK